MTGNWKMKSAVGLVETGNLFLSAKRKPGALYFYREYKDRLAIWRGDGNNLTWEEVQAVKEALWPGRVCVEIYPAEKDVINLRPTRHLWYTPELEALVNQQCRHPEFEKEEEG